MPTSTFPDVDSDVAVEQLDTKVAEALVPHSEALAIRVIGSVSDLSDQKPLYAAAAATMVTGVLLRDGRTWRAGTRVLAAHLLATALRGVIKKTVDRTRPDAAAKRGDYVLEQGERYETDFNSFPSGHTAGAVAVACAVGRAYPGSVPVPQALAALAGVAQVIRSKHFISDVLAGSVIGFVAEQLISGLIRHAERV